MTYRRHGSYLPVESAWLQEVPTSWRYSPLWPYFHVIEDRAGNGAETLELLSVSQTLGVLPRSAISDKEPRADDLSNYRHCRAGDVVINRMSAYQGAVGVSPQEGIVSPDYLVLRCSDLLRPGFLVHLLKSSGIIGEIVLRLRGIGTPGAGTVRTPRIGASELGRISIPLPSVAEQDAILTALGCETAQIDGLIGKQERLIELLVEKRQAVITHAVTKGLDPTAPTKPSGIPLLGDVPAHWTVGPAKRFFRSLDNQRIPLSTVERADMQGDYPYYGASGIIDYVDDFIYDRPLVLVSEDGANLLARSSAIAFVATGRYWVNNHAHILQPITDSVEFWAARIECEDLTPVVTGSAQPKLTIEALMNLQIAAPEDPEETRRIQEFIVQRSSSLDALLDKAKTVVRVLRERRSALISAAVTGKIDVREGAA